METTQVTTTVADALKKVQEDNLSMYRLSIVATEILGRLVRPQMFYIYRKQGMIKPDQNGRISKAAAQTFLVKFCGKHLNK